MTAHLTGSNGKLQKQQPPQKHKEREEPPRIEINSLRLLALLVPLRWLLKAFLEATGD
jgi:hypothetical protein